MPTRGNPMVCLRLTQDTLNQIDEAVISANARRVRETYDRASWIRQCVREKLAKLRRGRGERVAGLRADAGLSEPPGATEPGNAVPYAGDPLAGDQE